MQYSSIEYHTTQQLNLLNPKQDQMVTGRWDFGSTEPCISHLLEWETVDMQIYWNIIN